MAARSHLLWIDPYCPGTGYLRRLERHQAVSKTIKSNTTDDDAPNCPDRRVPDFRRPALPAWLEKEFVASQSRPSSDPTLFESLSSSKELDSSPASPVSSDEVDDSELSSSVSQSSEAEVAGFTLPSFLLFSFGLFFCDSERKVKLPMSRWFPNRTAYHPLRSMLGSTGQRRRDEDAKS